MSSPALDSKTQKDPEFLAEAPANLDLRTYLGQDAHPGQTFNIDTALMTLGNGRFTEVSTNRFAFMINKISIPVIGSAENLPVSLDLIGDGRGTLRIGGDSFEATCKPVRYWLEVSFFSKIWHTVSLWRDGEYSMFQYGGLRGWLTPTSNAQQERTALPDLTRGPAGH